jgi:hypothetical protein
MPELSPTTFAVQAAIVRGSLLPLGNHPVVPTRKGSDIRIALGTTLLENPEAKNPVIPTSSKNGTGGPTIIVLTSEPLILNLVSVLTVSLAGRRETLSRRLARILGRLKSGNSPALHLLRGHVHARQQNQCIHGTRLVGALGHDPSPPSVVVMIQARRLLPTIRVDPVRIGATASARNLRPRLTAATMTGPLGEGAHRLPLLPVEAGASVEAP